ncbi:MAG: hypothetical protein AB7O88_13070 [Reyranellaceae bacterium]
MSVSMFLRAAIAGATLTIGLSGAALAVDTNTVNPRTPWIDGREARQQTRIYSGAQDGSLTPHEFQRLERGQARIDRAEARARADGVVTRGERRHLDHMLHRQSAAIYHQRHDRQGVRLPRR